MKLAMDKMTIREIRSEIERDGWWEYDGGTRQESGSYRPAIIRARVRGYVEISVCKPYGGSEHFVVNNPNGTGSWHIRGLDVNQARKYAPARGRGLAAVIGDLDVE